jgi:hypothetical protein
MTTAAPLQKAAAKPLQAATAKPLQAACASLLLQRKCACGTGTFSVSGECTECSKNKMVGVQTTFRINEPGDAYEQEADRVAEQVLLTTPTHPDVSSAPPRIQRFSNRSNVQMHAAPDSVGQVLASTGRPLEPALRHDMERRFGHDFSRVRVHLGGAAEQSAGDMNANAYTMGHDIAFAAGRYAPGTHKGRRLIAHELAHVVQQSRAGVGERQIRRQPASSTMPTTPMPGGATRPATPEERRDFAQDAAEFLRLQGESFVKQLSRNPRVTLEKVLKNLRTTAENGLAAIANDPAATAVADALRTAYRDAVRSVLVARTRQPVPGGVPPTLHELFEEHRDAILPFGLPQAEADTAADELSAELAAKLPLHPTAAQLQRHAAIESARQNLRMATGDTNIDIDAEFSGIGKTVLPANTAVRLASSIPASLHRGLSNVAGQLVDNSSLALNTTVMLALDLTPHGGGYDAYRFTRLDLGQLGSEILIERQGAIGIEGLLAEQRRLLQERFDRLGFRRGGFSQEEFDQVLIALGEIPEAQLATLGNLRFERQADDPANPNAAGRYDPTAHAVQLFDRAFGSSMTRHGRLGRVLKFGAHATAHEIGHALDLSTLRTSQAATARALSGARWTMGNPNTVTEALPQGAQQPAFRQAALADGGPAGRQLPTNYPNPNPAAIWQEYFAESFAMFQTSPDLLRRLRPNVFQFMQQQFPKGP